MWRWAEPEPENSPNVAPDRRCIRLREGVQGVFARGGGTEMILKWWSRSLTPNGPTCRLQKPRVCQLPISEGDKSPPPQGQTPDCPPLQRAQCSQRDGHTFSTPPPGRTPTGRQAGPAPLAESGCPGLAGGSWVEAAGHSSSAWVGRTVSHPAGPVPPWASVGARGPSQSAAATKPTIQAPPLPPASGLLVPRGPLFLSLK